MLMGQSVLWDSQNGLLFFFSSYNCQLHFQANLVPIIVGTTYHLPTKSTMGYPTTLDLTCQVHPFFLVLCFWELRNSITIKFLKHRVRFLSPTGTEVDDDELQGPSVGRGSSLRWRWKPWNFVPRLPMPRGGVRTTFLWNWIQVYTVCIMYIYIYMI